jgi:uncharacterized membrane protein YidH (DUF202 family)
MQDAPAPGDNAMAINEAQLLLAEKRTALAVLRTGIALIALPMSIMSFLIATSRYYEVVKVLHLLIPLGILCLLLGGFGGMLVFSSLKRMQRYDRLIREIKRRHSIVAKFLD